MSCGDGLYNAMVGAIALMAIAFGVILVNMGYRISRIGKVGDK